VLPKVRQAPEYHSNAAKRKCVELDPEYHDDRYERSEKIEQTPQDPHIDVTEKSPTAVPLQASSQSNAAQAFQIPQQGQGGNGVSKGAMNESLKVALRQQVFPHVNQCLAHYRLSIDNATRRQLGKKVSFFLLSFLLGYVCWSSVTEYELGSMGNMWRGLHEQPHAK
jgi:hypothetical protein